VWVLDDPAKVNIFNYYFQSPFMEEDISSFPELYKSFNCVTSFISSAEFNPVVVAM